MKKYLAILAILSIVVLFSQAQTTKYGPHMGWSSWNTYGVNITEALVKLQADCMANNGYKEAGYTYINIDDGHFGGRDEETGKLKPHPSRFPKGLRPLVDYIHSKGLLAGIYSDAGINTCGSEGSGDLISLGCGMGNHYDQDADYYFVENDFDFIKVDFCGGRQLQDAGEPVNDRILYGHVSDALRKAGTKVGKDIKLNICRWSYPGTWCEQMAASWRTTGDIYCSWESVKNIIKQNLYLSAFCSPGHFNDMDMLEVGRGLSREEDITHFSMWCMLNSPLMIGCNMGSINSTTKKLLTNAELIALNQDTLYKQAYVVDNANGVYLLVRDILLPYDTIRAVAVYNSTDQEANYQIVFDKLDLGGKVKIRSLTYGLNLSQIYEDNYTVKVPAHGTRIFRFDAQERKERVNYEAETAYLSHFHEAGVTGAYSTSCDPASGGVKIAFLGASPDNDLQWRDVYSKYGGKYKCTLYYLLSGNRKISVQINNGKTITYSLTGNSWETPIAHEFEINLHPGINTIRLFSNNNEFCPDIDRITLESLEDPNAIKDASQNTEATDKAQSGNKKAQITDIQGRVIKDVKGIPTGTIYIKNGEKYIKR